MPSRRPIKSYRGRWTVARHCWAEGTIAHDNFGETGQLPSLSLVAKPDEGTGHNGVTNRFSTVLRNEDDRAVAVQTQPIRGASAEAR